MAELCQQIHVEVADEIGRLAEVTDKINAAGVNILACAWVEDGHGHLMMVTDDNGKACEAIKGSVDSCEQDDAVCLKLPNKPGQLGQVARKLADVGVNIQVIYATAGDAAEATIVMITDDDAKAAKMI